MKKVLGIVIATIIIVASVGITGIVTLSNGNSGNKTTISLVSPTSDSTVDATPDVTIRVYPYAYLNMQDNRQTLKYCFEFNASNPQTQLNPHNFYLTVNGEKVNCTNISTDDYMNGTTADNIKIYNLLTKFEFNNSITKEYADSLTLAYNDPTQNLTIQWV